MAEQSLLTSGYAEASGCVVSPLHFLATLQMAPTDQRMSRGIVSVSFLWVSTWGVAWEEAHWQDMII